MSDQRKSTRSTRDEARENMVGSADGNAAVGLGVFNSVVGLLPGQRLASTTRAYFSTGGNGTAR